MFVYLLNNLAYTSTLYEVQKKIVKTLEESGITYNDWNDLQHFLNEDISKALANKQDNDIIAYNDVITDAGDFEHADELLLRKHAAYSCESQDTPISIRW